MSISQSYSAPATIQFQSQASGGTPPYTYLWTFPDSSTSTEANPTFVFSTAGSFNVTVVITDSASNSQTTTIPITVFSQSTGLSVTLAASPTSNKMMIHFNTSVSGGVAPYTYLLEFGDGNHTADGTNNHVYAKTGTYTATVKVTDSKDNTGTGTVNVIIA